MHDDKCFDVSNFQITRGKQNLTSSKISLENFLLKIFFKYAIHADFKKIPRAFPRRKLKFRN